MRAPITATSPELVRAVATTPAPDRARLHRDGLPEHGPELTLAQTINATLIDLLGAHPQALVFGQDVAGKGGVYGVTRGLRHRFGAARVFDTLLDEQTILGTALGTSLAGLLPIPEIQYLAYLHNAEDQLRGEAATLAFFSDGQYSNPMVVRIPGLAYQRGFGGHFHNDNSLAVLRDIPGLVVGCPSGAAEAPGMLRTLAGLALAEGRVAVFLEPIALYHSRDLHPGDNAWTAPYPSPDLATSFGSVALHGQGAEVLVVTFGNGVAMSLRAVEKTGVPATVLDLRWLAPLPIEELVRHAEEFPRVVIADETRRSGGVSEGVITALVEAGYAGHIDRVASDDTPIPLGPAAATVLLSEAAIAGALLNRPSSRSTSRRR